MEPKVAIHVEIKILQRYPSAAAGLSDDLVSELFERDPAFVFEIQVGPYSDQNLLWVAAFGRNPRA
jgi:hypothetical protein